MSGFDGFPIKSRLVKIPAVFITELMPEIDSLNELRVTLYCFWRLQNKGDEAPYLWVDEIVADKAFMSGLSDQPPDRRVALDDGLDRAVARGVLLRVYSGKPARALYLINTPRGRAMADGAASGKWNPKDGPDALLSLTFDRPNIFSLYEQNIGPLTPMLAEKIKGAESTYPYEWIDEAINISVGQNKRSWAYIEAILRRWQDEGRADNSNQTADGSRFISGKYRDEINH